MESVRCDAGAGTDMLTMRSRYDPVRPWKEVGPGGDKKWYSSWSTDGCNKTGGDGTQHTPCKPGGQLELLSAPTLRGPWTQLPATREAHT
jgi:hypothetical protein